MTKLDVELLATGKHHVPPNIASSLSFSNSIVENDFSIPIGKLYAIRLLAIKNVYIKDANIDPKT